MGGCRCSYRYCTVRSDGKTHLFHYPVFDKVRCHQWLTNAQRLDFLNLKISQLKNRVVCQHHFKDEMFMNYKKEKLTCTAVPTENGPFVQPVTKDMDNKDLIPYNQCIDLDNIEKEFITSDLKKANFPIKYSEFLTNCDFMDLETEIIDDVREKPIGKINSFAEDIRAISPKRIVNFDNNVDTKIQKQSQSLLAEIPVEKTVNLGRFNVAPRRNLQIIYENEKQNLGAVPTNNTEQNQEYGKQIKGEVNTNNTNSERKVNILSEIKYFDPNLEIPVNAIPIKPPFILKPVKPEIAKVDKSSGSTRCNQSNISSSNCDITIDRQEDKTHNVNDIINEVLHPQSISFHFENNNNTIINEKNASPNKLVTRKRLSDERLEKIEKKRRFNMKLKDIINDSLNNVQSPEKNTDSSRQNDNTGVILRHIDDKCDILRQNVSLHDVLRQNDKQYILTENSDKHDVISTNDHKRDIIRPKEEKRDILSQNVDAHLSSDSELPSMSQLLIKFLDARMQRMEANLLSRIDANSKSITDLKDHLHNDADSKVKKNSKRPVATNIQVHKKKLYKEISQFLSPETNSLIFEELFINPLVKPNKKRENDEL